MNGACKILLMNKVDKPYYLFGQKMDQKSLVIFAKSKINDDLTDDWEKEIFRFFLEWFDDNDFIKVKTSGSTGTPKTISLRKKHMVTSAKATLNFLELSEGDRALLCLPANYIAGKMMIVRALTGGLDLHYIQPSLNPEYQLNEQFKLMAVVPSMLSEILNSERIKDLEGIENILLGGSEIPFRDEEKLALLNNNIWHTYGMTETITHIALRKINGKNRSDWFTPLAGVNVSTSKDDTVKIDYHNIGVSSLITNDLAEIKENGDFKILGRKDNVIISGGLKIHPEVLEKKIADIIKNNFFIIGLDDEKLGQKVVLFIEGEIIKTNQQILSEISQKLSKTKSPKELIKVKQFERTISGKIIRKYYQQSI